MHTFRGGTDLPLARIDRMAATGDHDPLAPALGENAAALPAGGFCGSLPPITNSCWCDAADACAESADAADAEAKGANAQTRIRARSAEVLSTVAAGRNTAVLRDGAAVAPALLAIVVRVCPHPHKNPCACVRQASGISEIKFRLQYGTDLKPNLAATCNC